MTRTFGEFCLNKGQELAGGLRCVRQCLHDILSLAFRPDLLEDIEEEIDPFFVQLGGDFLRVSLGRFRRSCQVAY